MIHIGEYCYPFFENIKNECKLSRFNKFSLRRKNKDFERRKEIRKMENSKQFEDFNTINRLKDRNFNSKFFDLNTQSKSQNLKSKQFNQFKRFDVKLRINIGNDRKVVSLTLIKDMSKKDFLEEVIKYLDRTIVEVQLKSKLKEKFTNAILIVNNSIIEGNPYLSQLSKFKNYLWEIIFEVESKSGKDISSNIFSSGSLYMNDPNWSNIQKIDLNMSLTVQSTSNDKIPFSRKYNFIPEKRKLEQMSEKELSEINNFIVFNQYGKIKFLGCIDIRGFNIDDAIILEEETIKVDFTSPNLMDSKYRIPKCHCFLYNLKFLDDSTNLNQIEKAKEKCKKSNWIYLFYDIYSNSLEFEIKI